MKKSYLFLATAAILSFASCTSNEYLGDGDPNAQVIDDGAIRFDFNIPNMTRPGEFVGATAADKLGGMFVVEGTKGSEQTNSPSTTVVFDNYLVGYTANTAGKTESNTHNWEYVGLQSGITGRLSGSTWTALHPAGDKVAASQTIKFWDYSTDQYDFIAWSTGDLEAVTDAAISGSKVKVTRINTGSTLATDGFTLTALSATDLQKCYYTDINTVLKANYGAPVTLTFRNMAAKVRVALYETVPGYSIKDVKFYSADANPTSPTDLGTGSSPDNAVLFTMGDGVSLPQSGAVTVYYPHIGTAHRNNPPTTPSTKDYNKASVTVGTASGGATSTTQAFGALTAQYRSETGNEPTGKYLGMTLPTATFAGNATESYYTAVIPNTNGVPLTLRVDYTLVSTDGSDEEIKVYGAKAVVPATYTVWQPNYAYTYIFKISDNTNGWTSKTNTDPKGLFPITFDAVVTNFTDFNAEQTTVTTVATPSITTYQQGHVHTLTPSTTNDEYSKSQTAGVSTAVKDVYVQVMDNSGATPTLKTDLNGTNKSLLFKITKTSDGSDYAASEAEVMDALQNRTNTYDAASPGGRNGITLVADANISNTVDYIVNGVDDQPIDLRNEVSGSKVDNSGYGKAADIAISNLTANAYYAYVYSTTVPSKDEKVYHVAAGVTSTETAANYYEVKPSDIAGSACAVGAKAVAGKVYFVKNVDAKGTFVSWTFKQTKVDDDVEGLYEASIPGSKGTSSYSASNFYFDIYYQNNGSYAVKVIKVVD